MQTWSVTEFKAQALGILEQVVQTGEPVIVTKRGKAIVKVIPLPYGADVLEGAEVQVPGKLKGCRGNLEAKCGGFSQIVECLW